MMYLPIFEGKEGVRGFFTVREETAGRTPFDTGLIWKLPGAEGRVAVRPWQVHEDGIAVLRRQDLRRAQAAAGAAGAEPPKDAAGRPLLELELPATDGLVTDCSRFLLTTLHADCLPVYLYAPDAGAVALVHAGWRGTRAGIGPKAVRTLAAEFGARPEAMAAAVGPGISLCCFEVGPEVCEAFRESWPFADEFIRPGVAGKYMMDLKGINRRQLEEAGVEDVWVSDHCSCCEPELFYSYRREPGTVARMAAGIYLTDRQ